MQQPELKNLAIYFGSVNAMEASVRAWLPGTADMDYSLTGRILGPHCEFSRTLPATVSLRPTSVSTGIQSAAVIPDPCFWTPELPMLYEVRVELRQGDQGGDVIEVVERPLAIHKLEPRGRDLNLSGKRWVLRGVQQDSAASEPLSDWRTAGAAMLTTDVDDTMAAEAARLGVPLVALLRSTSRDEVGDELRRLARSPAVVAAAIDAEADLPHDIGLAAIDIRLAAHCRADRAPDLLPHWANLLLCESADAAEIGRVAAARAYPVIAFRPLRQITDLATARAACDVLQRDLAPLADLAGYIV